MYTCMFKSAGSTDPVQQRLREFKRDWNKTVSVFIDDLINYKQLINGHPNKFFKERSSIKEPIPANPVTILNLLFRDFQNIVQRSNAIASAQIEYSKNRKKKQLSSYDLSHDLISQSSSSVSRFFTKLFNPTFGFSDQARDKKYRMSLLNFCSDVSNNLDKFEVEILKSTKDSILKSKTILINDVWNKWDLATKAINTYKTLDIKSDGVNYDLINNIRSDYNKNKNFLNDNKVDNDLEILLLSFNDASDSIKEKLFLSITDQYKDIINLLNNKFSCEGKTIADIVEVVNKNNLEKTAQKFISKWLGKKVHEMSIFDDTSVYRLELYKISSEIKVLLNDLMNSLEQSMDIDQLLTLSNLINSKFSIMKGVLRALVAFVK
jgi:hypothetical protein